MKHACMSSNRTFMELKFFMVYDRKIARMF